MTKLTNKNIENKDDLLGRGRNKCCSKKTNNPTKLWKKCRSLEKLGQFLIV